jgi:hypothetical protein
VRNSLYINELAIFFGESLETQPGFSEVPYNELESVHNGFGSIKTKNIAENLLPDRENTGRLQKPLPWCIGRLSADFFIGRSIRPAADGLMLRNGSLTNENTCINIKKDEKLQNN